MHGCLHEFNVNSNLNWSFVDTCQYENHFLTFAAQVHLYTPLSMCVHVCLWKCVCVYELTNVNTFVRTRCHVACLFFFFYKSLFLTLTKYSYTLVLQRAVKAVTTTAVGVSYSLQIPLVVDFFVTCAIFCYINITK